MKCHNEYFGKKQQNIQECIWKIKPHSEPADRYSEEYFKKYICIHYINGIIILVNN